MSDEPEDDIKAISTLTSVLRPLDHDTRVRVLEYVLKKLDISLTGGPATSDHDSAPSFSTRDLNPTSLNPSTITVPKAVDIRSFAAEKKPKTVNERVSVVGYYLAHCAPMDERRDHLGSEDIKTYFIQAGFPLPTAPPNVTLANAKNAGYLTAQDRGQFRLNAVGYNLVAHKLPGGEPAPARQNSAKKAAKRKTYPKAKK